MKPQYLDAWRLQSLLRYWRAHGVMSAAVATPDGGRYFGMTQRLVCRR